ncbi:Acyl-[acyl-carrier-protein]--UDP-N-acetylglucosamine O-acyltransferase [Pseudobythopirellula maris]|uniref:Acyl-[acyl-carrier-protein]--UDP-N-acetylglucosamine O-acyltransferase n=1 Tax=Pseudobythopirellula maris TaxID=2527991 RepID=A0A5C5ZMJ8_9BACT|nr:acyl-ACP--UDP-N-acetylglucosamine O-acyltransferase [Pseudobythopirellula maris]TWT88316.1 Acyl-[acyl-carrier-protein]--UDP-N-acetylglucosamine O-acyltransferase [Pseudobythopirellula maris]
MSIHPLALVDPRAELGTDVSIGPFSVVEAGARVGDRCRLAARATIKTGVTLGAENMIGEGAVVGGMPQHLAAPAVVGNVVIGDRNQLRENVTVHRAMHEGAVTRIGDGCLMMVGAHVAHDCQVEDGAILTNNVMLAGHVEVGQRACLGGGVAVHQFCRVGRVAMIGGMARIIQDVPPFVMIDGSSGLVVGLNRIGIRRAGIERDEAMLIKQAYQLLYRSGLSHEERMERLAEMYPIGPASEFEPFLRGGTRGFVRERRTPPGATIRPIHDAVDDSAPTVEIGVKRLAG